jgi:cellobiose transport system permease protein
MPANSVEAPRADTAGAEATKKAKGPKSSIWARFDHTVVPYILISPFFILFIGFGIFPIVYSALISFQSYRAEYPVYRDGTSINLFTERWVGLENYKKVLTGWDFWQALINTFGIFVLSAVPQLIFALILASLLNRRLRVQSFYRVGILVPYITPIVASSIVFVTFFDRGGGQANWLLGLLGVHGTSGANGEVSFDGIDWRNQRWSAWLAIIIMINWKWTGYNALLYLAAMQSIPKDVYEAAALDGAGAWRQLWAITVPMIRPMVIFTVVLATIGSLQLFAEPVQFDINPASGDGGGTRHLWRTVAQLIWKTGWKDNNFGYGGAMSWVLFVVVVLLASMNAWLSNKIGGRK